MATYAGTMRKDIFRQGSSMPIEGARVDHYSHSYERKQQVDDEGFTISNQRSRRETLQISYEVATLAVLRGKGLDVLMDLTTIADPGCIHNNAGTRIVERFPGTWVVEKIDRQRNGGPTSTVTFTLFKVGPWEDDPEGSMAAV